MSTRLVSAIWAVFHSFLHGYHISALNGVQDAVTCDQRGSVMGLQKCIDIDSTRFGLVVTIYTLGGLLGSLSADGITRRFGRLGTLRVAELALLLGTAAVGLSNVWWLMLIGRVAVGTGSGLSLVTIPLLLNEISSKRYKSSFGILHQVSIGVGMIVAQSLSIPFAKPWAWRWVLVIGFGIAAVLFIGSGAVTLAFPHKVERHNEGDEEDEERPLVDRRHEEETKDVIGVKDLIHAESIVKRGVLVVIACQFAQQICGISPVMYFSTRILAPVFQGESKLIALTVMAVGLPFNFVPSFLPSSFTSKRLLLISSFGTSLTALLLGIGLNTHNRALSATSVFAFALSFSIGLAPIPWVVLPEVVPPEARTAGGAVAVSVNWLTNFAAGAVFLPLQQALKHGSKGEGNVFFVFTAASAVAFLSIWGTFRLYERVSQ